MAKEMEKKNLKKKDHKKKPINSQPSTLSFHLSGFNPGYPTEQSASQQSILSDQP
jgi:hypothetical protein